MIKFNAQDFYELLQFLSYLRGNIDAQPADYKGAPKDAETKEFLSTELSRMGDICQNIGLEMSCMHIERIKLEVGLDSFTYRKYAELLHELENRINDEVSLNSFMVIPRIKADFFERPELFGADVASRFPSAAFDIEEAGNCYATGRNTACVMHLMRTMEVALKAVGAALSIPDPNKANWQQIIDQINSKINQKRAGKSSDWLQVEPFFADVSAHLFAVKVAWRNPSMHLESKYDEQEAKRIYNAVEGFMQHLASRLDEEGHLIP